MDAGAGDLLEVGERTSRLSGGGAAGALEQWAASGARPGCRRLGPAQVRSSPSVCGGQLRQGAGGLRLNSVIHSLKNVRSALVHRPNIRQETAPNRCTEP